MFLPLVPNDKANHLFYGGIICVASSWAAFFIDSPIDPRAAGFFVSVTAAAAKEGIDWIENRKRAAADLPPNHDVEWGDFFWTCFGGALCASVAP
jgi:hypothetical protein